MEWSQYFDEEGYAYFYNNYTGDWSYDRPDTSLDIQPEGDADWGVDEEPAEVPQSMEDGQQEDGQDPVHKAQGAINMDALLATEDVGDVDLSTQFPNSVLDSKADKDSADGLRTIWKRVLGSTLRRAQGTYFMLTLVAICRKLPPDTRRRLADRARGLPVLGSSPPPSSPDTHDEWDSSQYHDAADSDTHPGIQPGPRRRRQRRPLRTLARSNSLPGMAPPPSARPGSSSRARTARNRRSSRAEAAADSYEVVLILRAYNYRTRGVETQKMTLVDALKSGRAFLCNGVEKLLADPAMAKYVALPDLANDKGPINMQDTDKLLMPEWRRNAHARRRRTQSIKRSKQAEQGGDEATGRTSAAVIPTLQLGSSVQLLATHHISAPTSRPPTQGNRRGGSTPGSPSLPVSPIRGAELSLDAQITLERKEKEAREAQRRAVTIILGRTMTYVAFSTLMLLAL